MKIIADVGNIDYYFGRSIESIGMAREYLKGSSLPMKNVAIGNLRTAVALLGLVLAELENEEVPAA